MLDRRCAIAEKGSVANVRSPPTARYFSPTVFRSSTAARQPSQRCPTHNAFFDPLYHVIKLHGNTTAGIFNIVLSMTDENLIRECVGFGFEYNSREIVVICAKAKALCLPAYGAERGAGRRVFAQREGV